MISIVTPTYNSGSYLAHTVASVLGQSIGEWELILVDDGSSDGTAERAEAWCDADPRIRFLRQDHRGGNHARNLGLARCSVSSWAVAFLDHDDVLESTALRTLGGRLKAHPEAVAAYGIAGYIDEGGHPYDGGLEAWTRSRLEVTARGLVAVEPSRNTGFGVLALGNRIPTPGQVLIRRSALEQTGGWDAETSSAADYDLWVRLSLLGDFLFIDERVIGWRQHAGNLSKQNRQVERSLVMTRRKVASDRRLTSAQRKLVLMGYKYTQLSMMRTRMNWAIAYLRRGEPMTAAKQVRHAVVAYIRSALGLGSRVALP